MDTHALTPAIIRPRPLALTIFTVVFTALAVVVPTIFHQFNLAGPRWLPMHLFVLIAALLFGWRVGVLVGAASPLISFAFSGLPPVMILPQLTIEVAVYGLVAGLLRQYTKLNLYFSLLLSMVAGRLVLGVAAWILLPKHPAIFATSWAATEAGWPGIVLQLLLVPPAVLALREYLARDHQTPSASV